MGFEPTPSSARPYCLPHRLPQRGPAPSCPPHEGDISPSKPHCRGFNREDGVTLRLSLILEVGENWSGRWDLNPRQLAWEARTLPLSYARSQEGDQHSRCVEDMESR